MMEYLTEKETVNSSKTFYAIRDDDTGKAYYFTSKAKRDKYFDNEFKKHNLMNSYFFKEYGKAHDRKWDLGK